MTIIVPSEIKQQLRQKLIHFTQQYPNINTWTIGIDPATQTLTTTFFHQDDDRIIGKIPYQHQNSPELQRTLTVDQITKLLNS